jgi:hypothetical protein
MQGSFLISSYDQPNIFYHPKRSSQCVLHTLLRKLQSFLHGVPTERTTKSMEIPPRGRSTRRGIRRATVPARTHSLMAWASTSPSSSATADLRLNTDRPWNSNVLVMFWSNLPSSAARTKRIVRSCTLGTALQRNLFRKPPPPPRCNTMSGSS